MPPEDEWLKEFHGGIDSGLGHGYVVDWGHPLWAWGDRMGSSYQAWVQVKDVDEWAHLKHLTDAEMSAEFFRESLYAAASTVYKHTGAIHESVDAVMQERCNTLTRFVYTPHFREWNSRKEEFDERGLPEGDSGGDNPETDVPW